MKRHQVFTSIISFILLATAIGAVVAANRVHLPTKRDEVPLALVKRGCTDEEVSRSPVTSGQGGTRSFMAWKDSITANS